MDNQYCIQLIGRIMSQSSVSASDIKSIIIAVDNQLVNATHIIGILENIFTHQKSDQIVIAVQILYQLIKGCNRNFHQSANNKQFQNSIIGLLKQIRGKKSYFKAFTSNKKNWQLIQNKVLSIIQLWYDIFILEEDTFPHIIHTYKLLRSEAITFPIRNPEDIKCICVQTQSPIIANIENIQREDNFIQGKQHHKTGKSEDKHSESKHRKDNYNSHEYSGNLGSTIYVNLYQFGQKLQFILDEETNPEDAVQVIDNLKRSMKMGKIMAEDVKNWDHMKRQAQKIISRWQINNQRFIKTQTNNYPIIKQKKKTVSMLEETTLGLMDLSWDT